jgi:nitroimidazol reductase NimA-like FMN-containing flavoprotein (pyridoxamine 5'-phosphate oxidase superfamily)
MTESWLEELSHEECAALLRTNSVGRIGIVLDGLPLVLPINYQLVDTSDRLCLMFRTRSGNVIDRAISDAAFEIDGIDPSHRRGWSVLIRGTLHHVEADNKFLQAHFDPNPWLSHDRNAWLLLEPSIITGRRLIAASLEWAFHESAYL